MTLIGASAPQEQVAMPSVDVRRMLAVAISAEGVKALNDLKVSQRAAGANMSVDVAAGEAYILDDHAGSNAGGFYWAKNDAAVNLAIAAASPSNPRVDRVILEVLDAFLGDAENTRRLRVLTGTPTAGATLANCNGAAAVPGSALLLGNVLVAASDSSITDGEIDTTGASNNNPKVRPRLVLAGTLANQAVKARNTTGQSLGAGSVWVAIPLATEDLDDWGGHDPAVNPARVTAVEAGRYMAHGNLNFSGQTGTVVVYSAISHYNSANVLQARIQPFGGITPTGTGQQTVGYEFVLAAGDYLQLEGYSGSSGAHGTVTAELIVNRLG